MKLPLPIPGTLWKIERVNVSLPTGLTKPVLPPVEKMSPNEVSVGVNELIGEPAVPAPLNWSVTASAPLPTTRLLVPVEPNVPVV